MVERLADPGAVDPVAAIREAQLLPEIRQMVRRLEPREKRIIGLRFGLGQDEPRTLQEIGQALGLSRERVRQLESHALSKLRRWAARRQLGPSL
jgi:RNA polymerase primary sigma factor